MAFVHGKHKWDVGFMQLATISCNMGLTSTVHTRNPLESMLASAGFKTTECVKEEAEMGRALLHRSPCPFYQCN